MSLSEMMTSIFLLFGLRPICLDDLEKYPCSMNYDGHFPKLKRVWLQHEWTEMNYWWYTCTTDIGYKVTPVVVPNKIRLIVVVDGIMQPNYQFTILRVCHNLKILSLERCHDSQTFRNQLTFYVTFRNDDIDIPSFRITTYLFGWSWKIPV